MKINLEIKNVDLTKNILYFKFNGINYYYNAKTEFFYKEESKNKYSYDSKLEQKVKTIISSQYKSYKKYNLKLKEH